MWVYLGMQELRVDLALLDQRDSFAEEPGPRGPNVSGVVRLVYMYDSILPPPPPPPPGIYRQVCNRGWVLEYIKI